MLRSKLGIVRRAELWLPIGLFVLALVGSHLLRQDRFVHLSERDRTAYGLRPIWQARFDALSAAAGVGLLTYDLREDYTAAGRWVLAGLGLAGAALYLLAARQIYARLWAEGGEPLPRGRTILTAFAILQIASILLVWIVERLAGTAPAFPDSAWRALSAFASLGWLPPAEARVGGVYAVVALISAAGFLVWFGVPGLRGRFGHGLSARGLIVVFGSYVLFLGLCSGAVTLLEIPRGSSTGRPDQEGLRGAAAGTRFARSAVQVTAAAGAGLPTEQLADRGVSEGTKAVLAGVELVGGLGGAPAGGMTWLAVLWVTAGGVAGLGRARAGGDPVQRRCVLAGVALPGVMIGFTLLVALGLLFIETCTASAFQTAPTFADALLEAASATCGGGLSTGLTRTVTSAHLSRGIHQNVDLYQYGMTWLMMAMYVGRLLPLIVLARCAAEPGEPGGRPSP